MEEQSLQNSKTSTHRPRGRGWGPAGISSPALSHTRTTLLTRPNHTPASGLPHTHRAAKCHWLPRVDCTWELPARAHHLGQSTRV